MVTRQVPDPPEYKDTGRQTRNEEKISSLSDWVKNRTINQCEVKKLK
jgi:hypothetical protein